MYCISSFAGVPTYNRSHSSTRTYTGERANSLDVHKHRHVLHGGYGGELERDARHHVHLGGHVVLYDDGLDVAGLVLLGGWVSWSRVCLLHMMSLASLSLGCVC